MKITSEILKEAYETREFKINDAYELFNNLCKEFNNNYDLYMFNFNEWIYKIVFSNGHMISAENYSFPYIDLGYKSKKVYVRYKYDSRGFYIFSEVYDVKSAIEETKKLIDKLVKKNYDEFEVEVRLGDFKYTSFDYLPYARFTFKVKKINLF